MNISEYLLNLQIILQMANLANGGFCKWQILLILQMADFANGKFYIFCKWRILQMANFQIFADIAVGG